jgi:His-Xaa-Ser system radical SAM maturase HxsC
MRLTSAGRPVGLQSAIVGRVASSLDSEPSDSILVLDHYPDCSGAALSGFRAVITTHPLAAVSDNIPPGMPLIHSVRELDHVRPGDILALQPGNGFIRTLYRPDSEHNSLFMTERCNSNCLMCSQPPKDHDDSAHFIDTNLELIRLMKPGPSYLGITGGEPTLLRDGFFRIVTALKSDLPETEIHILTNGRLFAWSEFTDRFARIGHEHVSLGIPLYSDSAVVHDYVVQAKSAFDQTVLGLHHLARWQVPIEIRVVLHRATVSRLPQLAEYIYRNFPFVVQVALMGLEPTGYTPRNRDKLWIDPTEYQHELEEAVEILGVRGMNVSIYNSQLCLLRPSLWKFARKSISDWKNIYLAECERCSRREDCGGLFQSAEKLHSPHIRAFA